MAIKINELGVFPNPKVVRVFSNAKFLQKKIKLILRSLKLLNKKSSVLSKNRYLKASIISNFAI